MISFSYSRGDKCVDKRRRLKRLVQGDTSLRSIPPTARWQGRAKQLEKPSSSRREIGGAGNRLRLRTAQPQPNRLLLRFFAANRTAADHADDDGGLARGHRRTSFFGAFHREMRPS
jgi:hypothetical protein